ncbi:MAG: rod shape-determining protein MreD [Gemmatimonadetes bacterium]|nr:rod shape-determining protein MreD [Gemmatimonadota bacterium]|tara:strand:- start:134 stop:640 length:507 start_codon:yes stop_codon:yes gene_type:complete
MTIVRHVLLLIFALLVQTSWAHTLDIFGLRPDFTLLLVVYVGIVSGQVEATILGFVSGFLLDVYNPAFMGVNALSNAVIGFAVGYSREGIVTDELRVLGLVVFIAGLIQNLIFFVFSSFSNLGAILPAFVRTGIGSALYSAVIGILLLLAASIRFQGGLRLDVRRLHE